MRKIVCIILVCALPCAAHAGPLQFLDNNVMSPAYKTIARMVLAAVPVRVTRRRVIRIIKRMDKMTFQREYAMAYPYLSRLPQCGVFASDATRNDIIHYVSRVTKEKVLIMIAHVPSKLVGYAVKKYIFKQRTDEL